ncbi:hypothetical protein [Pseudarthrobacter sp. NPDC058119]|uniref:hypothetical protein n=1 Tax=Pseudarthrobacter sp. NPDC058119 TaxID=3346348 RepID=UPI0036DAD4A3
MTRATAKHHDKALPAGRIVRKWKHLEPGTWVEALSEDGELSRAYVDDLAADGSIIWLVTEGSGHRSLHLKTDPLTLYTCE